MADFTTGHAIDFTEVGTETDPTDPLESDDGESFTDADADSDQTNYAEPGQGESFAGQDPSIWSIQGDADDGSTFTSDTPAIETETLPTDGDEEDSEPLQGDNPAVEVEDRTDPPETVDEEPEEVIEPEPEEPVTVDEPQTVQEVIERDDELEGDDQLILDENTYGPDYEDSPQSIAEIAYTGTQEEQELELDIESDDELTLLAMYTELEMLDPEDDLLNVGEVIFEETNLVEFMDLDTDPFGDSDDDGFINFVDETDEGF